MSDELPQSTEQTPIAEPVSGTEAPAESSGDKITETMSKVYDRHNAPRSEKGQFAKTEPTEPVEQPQAKQPKKSEGPISWTAAMRERLAQAPKDVQDYITQREAEAQKRLSELGNEAKSAKSLTGIIERYASRLPENYRQIPTDKQIELLYQANEILLHNPEAAIQYLARSHNVDLGKLGTDPQAAQRQEAQQAHMARQAYEFLEAERAKTLTKMLETFVADKGDHWKDIESAVAYHVTAIKATDHDLTPREIIKEAYDRALKDNPQVAAKLPAAREKAAKEREAQTRKAAEAKRLASLNVGSKSTGKSASARKDIYADLEDIYDRIQSRG